VDAGLVIHEGQLTIPKAACNNVIDLGRCGKKVYDCRFPWAQMPAPIPA